MKSIEETARSVISRRDEGLRRLRKRNRRLAAALSAGAAVFAIAAAIIVTGRDSVNKDTASAVNHSLSGENAETETVVNAPETDIIWMNEGYGDEPQRHSALGVSDEAISFGGRDGSIGIQTDFCEKVLSAASADSLIAFSFDASKGTAAGIDKMQEELSNECYLLSGRADEALFTAAERLEKDKNITNAEAMARATGDSEYLRLVGEYREKAEEYERYLRGVHYERNKDTIETFEKLGFTVISKGTDDDFDRYLCFGSGGAVLAGTKEQIDALSLEDFEGVEHITLYGSSKADLPRIYGEPKRMVHLREDSKLTDELLAAYEENGGAALKVRIQAGWDDDLWGEWVDPHVYAYEAIGLHSEEEFNEAGPDILTSEKVDLFYEVLNKYTYWVNEERFGSFFKEGELIEARGYAWDLIAELTCERAQELCENKCIAYVTLPDLNESEGIESVIALDE